MVTGTQAPRPQELGKKHQELETNTELVVAQALTGGGLLQRWPKKPTRTTCSTQPPRSPRPVHVFLFFEFGNCVFFFVRSIFKAQEWQKDPPRFHPFPGAQPGLFHNLSCEEKTQVFFKVKEMSWIITNHWTYSIPRRFWMILILKYCILPEG